MATYTRRRNRQMAPRLRSPKKRRVVAAAALLIACAVGASAAMAGNPNPGLLPPNASAFGHTYGEWSAAWWQWAFSIPATGHPLFAEGAVDCGAEQSGHVWFLVGVWNATGITERSCTIPSGTALFFPLANVECSTVEPPPFFGADDDALGTCADAFSFAGLQASVDGVAFGNLRSYEVFSPPFDFTVPNDNILGIPGGSTGRSVGKGVYLLLTPLPPGKHTIRFRALLPDFGATQDITYHLTVVPRGRF